MTIRFNNLPYLLKDMEQKKWIIDSFPFRYKTLDFIVILKLYKQNEMKPSPYAKATVEFIKRNDTNASIKGYIDFFNVKFKSVDEFCNFFQVKKGNANRNLFDDFSELFAKFIPREKVTTKTDIERSLIGRRAEENNPNAVYCFDVRRNGKKEDGTLNERSIENSNKADSLRSKLYERYCADTNLSFFFSDDPKDEKTDKEIMENFASR